jgi:hypothetical protein
MALTVSEQEQLNNLRAEAARLQAELDATEPEPTQERSMASKVVGTASDIVVPAGGATVGQGIGAIPLFSIPTAGLSVPIGGAIGGSVGYLANELAQGRAPTMGGLVNVATTSSVPGAPVARLGSAALRSEAAKQAMASMAGTQAERAIDEGQPISPMEAALAVGGSALGVQAASKTGRGAVRADLVASRQNKKVVDRLRLAQSIGYSTDPVAQNPSAFTKGIERLEGGQAVAQAEIARINQPVTNKHVRYALGLPADAQLNGETLEELKKNVAAPYRQLEQLSPMSGKLLDRLNTLRRDARDLWKDYSVNARVETRREAERLTAQAEGVETALEKLAKNNKANPKLVDEMKEARRKLARIFVAESALNDATQNIDAIVLGKIHESNKNYLDGALRVVAEIANTQPAVMKEFVRPPSGSANYLGRSALAATFGAAGYGTGGVPGAIAGGLAGSVADIPFRSLSVSKAYQQAFGIPRYESLTTPQAVQTFLMQSGRQAPGLYDSNNPPRSPAR